MKPVRFTTFIITLGLAVASLTGCGKKHDAADGHDHGAEKAEGKDDGHGHEEEAPSGASFKAGKGVILTPETRKILGVEVADVTEQKLPFQLRFSLQVFGEKHHHAVGSLDHTGCDVHGSGFVSSNSIATIKPGQTVQIPKSTNTPLAGVVVGVQRTTAFGEAEIVVGVSNAATALKTGEFVPAIITLPRNESVTAVPKSAVLRTSEGTFVYAVNGDAFFRTAVKTGTESDEFVEITDGLLAGDQVVTKPVQTFWLIELRATKGGGHSH